MRKGLLIFIITILFLLCACDLSMMEEGSSINEYIFPYVEFTLSEDGTYYTASILPGATLDKLYIPSYADNYGTSTPVKYFTGFQREGDEKNLVSTVLESSLTEIKLNSLNNAAVLETLSYKTIESDNTVWKNLPDFPHSSATEFVGWFTTDTDQQVKNGETMQEGHTTIYAKRQKIELVYHQKVEPTCTESGNLEYWQCDHCERLFSDSECKTEILQSTIPALGHATIYVKEKQATCTENGVKAHYECSRCHAYFEDEEATKPTTLAALTTSALGHDWVFKHGERIVDGHWKECSRCQETKDSEPHDYSIKEVTKEPTHEKPGIMTYTLSLIHI